MWSELGWGDALRPLVSGPELRRLLGAGAMFAGLPGWHLPALLDPSPLRRTLERAGLVRAHHPERAWTAR